MLQRTFTQPRLNLVSRRPAVGIAVPFLIGILTHPYIPTRPTISLSLATAFLLASLFILRRPRLSTLLLALGWMIAGLLAAQLARSFYPPTEIGLFSTSDRQLISLELRIIDPPRIIDSTTPQRPEPHQFTRAIATSILTSTGRTPATGQILLRLSPPLPNLSAGQALRATGWLSRCEPAMNPGQFDFAQHYRDRRLLSTFSIPHADQTVQFLNHSSFQPLAYLKTKTRDLLSAGFSSPHHPDLLFLQAILLGDRDAQLRDVQELFAHTGTSHLLAISGLHVVIVAACAYFLCRLLQLHPRKSSILVMLVVLLYGLIALPTSPAIRAVLLSCAVLTGSVFRRPADSINLLSLAAVAMLLLSPLDLYDPGFQLSFGVVLGLCLFTPHASALLWPPDRDQALAPKPHHRPWPTLLQQHLRELLTASLVAWFVSLPMVFYYFDRLNLYAALDAILLFPFLFLTVAGGLLKVLLTLLLPPFAHTLATTFSLPAIAMRHVVERLSHLPYADITVAPLPSVFIPIYYLLLFIAIFSPLAPRNKRRLLALTATLVISIPLYQTYRLTHHPGHTRLTILSVGAGSCAVIELADGQVLLIDAGSSDIPDPYDSVLSPFFRTHGIRHIDAAFVSHADFDHLSAISQAAQSVGISRLYISPQFKHDASDRFFARMMLQSLSQTHCPIQILTAGQSLSFSGTQIDTLWPPNDPTLDNNNSSLVLRLTAAGQTILLPGDIESLAMSGLLNAPDLLRSNTLIAPHHGSFEDATVDFVNAVSPSQIISSDDDTPTSKQRTFDDQVGTHYPVLHTHLTGAVSLDLHDGITDISPFRSAAAVTR